MCKIDAREGTESLVTIGAAVLEIYRSLEGGGLKKPPPPPGHGLTAVPVTHEYLWTDHHQVSFSATIKALQRSQTVSNYRRSEVPFPIISGLVLAEAYAVSFCQPAK